jgi:hypothetical protein
MDEGEVGPNGRPLDPVWEALIEETQAVPEMERGALNTARRAILAVCQREGIHPDDVPKEIRIRAQAYRDHPTFSRCALSPTALAKNWCRVVGPTAQTSEQQAFAALRSASHGSVTL